MKEYFQAAGMGGRERQRERSGLLNVRQLKCSDISRAQDFYPNIDSAHLRGLG